MRAVGRVMSQDEETGSSERGEPGAPASRLLEEHAAVMGRVAMALLGDAAHVERVLEHVAREVGAKGRAPEGAASPAASGSAPTKEQSSAAALVWLLGLVRAASATQLSKLPLRTRLGGAEAAPVTERMGSKEAVAARASLAALKPTEREAVVLSLVGGLDTAGVAAACNVDVATIEARIARGLEQLLLEGADGEAGGAR